MEDNVSDSTIPIEASINGGVVCKTTPPKFSTCLKQTLQRQDLRKNWISVSPIVNLGTKWRWMFSFRPRPLYHGESPCYALEKRLDAPESWSGLHAEQTFLSICQETNPIHRSSVDTTPTDPTCRLSCQVKQCRFDTCGTTRWKWKALSYLEPSVS